MPKHWQPQCSKSDIAEDIRDYVRKYSDGAVNLSTLDRLSRPDLVVLALAFQDMERKGALLEFELLPAGDLEKIVTQG